MPAHFFVGFGLIPMIFEAALVIAFVWLMIKFGKVLDAYSAKLKK